MAGFWDHQPASHIELVVRVSSGDTTSTIFLSTPLAANLFFQDIEVLSMDVDVF